MNFGQALEVIKNGGAVTRESWQNPAITVSLIKGAYDYNGEDFAGNPTGELLAIQGIDISLFDKGDNGIITRLPHLNIKNRYGSNLPFNPNGDSILASDWVLANQEVPKQA